MKAEYKQENSKLKPKRQNKTVDAIEEDERGTEHYKSTILI
jgi:hypothetical protein